MVLMLILPFAMMWNIGGFDNGSNIIIWAFLSPIMALLYTEKKEPFYWLVAFILLLNFSVAIDPLLGNKTIEHTLKEFLFLVNTSAVLSGIYVVTPEKFTLSLFANYRNLSVNLQSKFYYQYFDKKLLEFLYGLYASYNKYKILRKKCKKVESHPLF